MSIDWSKIKHFKQREFCCKCGCGYCDPHPQLVAALDLARSKSSVPFIISSGCRCDKHNNDVGGTKNSSHVIGYAVDLSYASGAIGIMLLKALTPFFDRIGVGKGFIHVDIDPAKPTPTLWTY